MLPQVVAMGVRSSPQPSSQGPEDGEADASQQQQPQQLQQPQPHPPLRPRSSAATKGGREAGGASTTAAGQEEEEEEARRGWEQYREEQQRQEQEQEQKKNEQRQQQQQEMLREGSTLIQMDEKVLVRPNYTPDSHDALPHYVAMYSSNAQQQQTQQQQQQKQTQHQQQQQQGLGQGQKKAQDVAFGVGLLKALLPNKRWTDAAGEWVQSVSSRQLQREELLALGDRLVERLGDAQARRKPVCSVREEAFSQMLDEIIRQVAVSCPERGLMLLRVRNELRMSLELRVELHRDSVNYSVAKADSGLRALESLEEEALSLSASLQQLRRDVKAVEHAVLSGAKREASKRQALEASRKAAKASLEMERAALDMWIKSNGEGASQTASSAGGGAKAA